jgi:hypothetical protein
MACRFAVNCNDWAFFVENVSSLGRRRFCHLTHRGFLLPSCVELGMNPRLRNAIKGAIFGAKVGVLIALLVMAVMQIVIAFNPLIRGKFLEQSGGPLQFIGGIIAGLAMVAFYGAATGAIVRFIFPPR